MFVRCVSAQRTGQSDQFKMVKATDFKSDVHAPRHSPDITLKSHYSLKNSLGGDMRSHEGLLVLNLFTSISLCDCQKNESVNTW